MPRRDTSHDTVRRSLERDGWRITHDPYPVRLGDLPMGIDLGAEKLIAADRNDRKIAVEIKSFVTTSDLSTFHTALGSISTINLLWMKRSRIDRCIWPSLPRRGSRSL
jgi:hypothetical protein